MQSRSSSRWKKQETRFTHTPSQLYKSAATSAISLPLLCHSHSSTALKTSQWEQKTKNQKNPQHPKTITHSSSKKKNQHSHKRQRNTQKIPPPHQAGHRPILQPTPTQQSSLKSNAREKTNPRHSHWNTITQIQKRKLAGSGTEANETECTAACGDAELTHQGRATGRVWLWRSRVRSMRAPPGVWHERECECERSVGLAGRGSWRARRASPSPRPGHGVLKG